MSETPIDSSKRTWLIASGCAGAVGGVATAVPFVSTFQPSEKAKAAGADAAITQYFYNSDAYFRFVEDTYKLGADIPVVPGIMPISSSTQLMRFSDACGAEIPRWIRLRLQAFGDDTASIKAFGLDVVTDLCDQLRSAGVPALHFYTMNQSAATLEICRRLEL